MADSQILGAHDRASRVLGDCVGRCGVDVDARGGGSDGGCGILG